MPEQEQGAMRGFQLWINLPAAEKMTAPAYQEFKAALIPVVKSEGVRVKIIAGAGPGSVTGPVRAPHVEALYFDLEMAPGSDFAFDLPESHEGFFVLYEGEAEAPGMSGPMRLSGLTLAALGPGRTARLTAGARGAKALLLAARPLREPVAWSGPFVMNTNEELVQAYDDFRAGRFWANSRGLDVFKRRSRRPPSFRKRIGRGCVCSRTERQTT
jgi:hypothetical protein